MLGDNPKKIGPGNGDGNRKMRRLILIAAGLAVALGLSGCANPQAPYTIYYQGAPSSFASPYDDPSMYRGPMS
jgi:hypothetical protein